MKKQYLSSDEQKQVLLDLLCYFDSLCRKNKIKYSLIGGSLIGAIRHHGFIPWDDDVDVILTSSEYKKLMKVLKGNKQYLLLTPDNSDTYRYPFPKLVDARTVLEETKYGKIENYGVYMDIFSYHYISNNGLVQVLQYAKQLLVKKLFVVIALSNRETNNGFKRLLLSPLKLISNRRTQRLYSRICSNGTPTRYVFSNWPCYSRKKETQLTKNTNEYIDVEFEGKNVMAFKHYDEILRTTFGDYMTPPPEGKRTSSHEIKVYWKNDNNKRKER